MPVEINGKITITMSYKEALMLKEALIDKRVEFKREVAARRKAGNTDAADRLQEGFYAIDDLLTAVKQKLGHL